MKILSDLGSAIERRWCELEYAEPMFPRVAEEALRRFRGARALTPENVARWLIEAPEVPAQHAQALATFGQPPVMAFRGDRFFIEILFWFDGDTAIHEHGFSGAFMMLEGSSIHAEYRFAFRKRVSSNIGVGALRRTSVELLRKGDVRPIIAGDRMIHSTFHLDRPTLTLVVRTYTEAIGTPPYAFLAPAIALFAQDVPTRIDRQLRLLDLLRHCDSATFARSAARFLRRCDYYAATLFFRRHYTDLLRASPRILKTLLVIARGRHKEFVDAWPEVFEEQARLSGIEGWRSQLEDPEHRFLLALLLSVSDRKSILALVAKRFPGRSPKKVVFRWVRELTAPDAAKKGIAFPLTLGAASLTVVGWRLDGLSWPRIEARVRKECAPGDFEQRRKNVRALAKKLNASLLRPLFV